ncbi:MAG: RsmD family RNA methyltransferase, partial [Neisseriaceae bacterium]|nr:RsmD family RNA methyltransferase [Neisseriaceae bacterium]
TTNALNFLEETTQKFDIVFIDPPYAYQEWQILWQKLPNILKTNAEVYIESNQKIALPHYLHEKKNGKCGMSYFVLAEYIQAA